MSPFNQEGLVCSKATQELAVYSEVGEEVEGFLSHFIQAVHLILFNVLTICGLCGLLLISFAGAGPEKFPELENFFCDLTTLL